MGTTMVQNISLQEMKSGKHGMTSAIVLQFSAPLDGADAQDLGAYSLVTMARSKKHKSKPVRLMQVRYNSSAFTATLFTRKPIISSMPLLLTVKTGMLLDSQGLPVDGGTNVLAILNKSGATITSAVPLVRSSRLSAPAVDALLGRAFSVDRRDLVQ
jgi:hypothetical protein